MWITWHRLVLLIIIVGLTSEVNGLPSSPIKIGGIFSNSLEERVFRLAVDFVNKKEIIGHGITLDYVSNVTSPLDAFQNIQLACNYMERGVMAIIGPMSSTSVKAVATVSAAIHVPQISPAATNPRLGDTAAWPYLVRMMPPDTKQSLALVDLVTYFGWKRMAILSSNTEYGVNGLVTFQSEAANKGWVIHAVQRFRAVYPVTDIVASKELEFIRSTDVRVIILHCLAHMATEVLKQAKGLGMTEPGWAWIVTDGTTGMGLVGISPQTRSGRLYPEFVYEWEDMTDQEHTRETRENFDAYSALVVDAVLTFAYAANAMFADPSNQHINFNTSTLTCEQTMDTNWGFGHELLQHIHNVRGDGVASFIEFGPQASPLRPAYTIVSSSKDGWIQVGQWNPQERLQMSRPHLITFMGGRISVHDSASSLVNKTLRVVTNEYPPFSKMLTENYTRSNIPAADITGFTIDFLKEMARIGGFSYMLYLQEHDLWGTKDKNTGKWNGVIGDIIDGKADIGLDLGITAARERDLDFTQPYAYGRLKFIMKKPKETPVRPFQFLDPFTNELWVYILMTTVLVAIAMSFFNKLSPNDYHGLVVYALNGNLENKYIGNFSEWKKFKKRQAEAFRKLSLSSSIFHCISYLLSQGADYCPKSVSGRVTAVLWWLAIVILTSTYTANLTAYVTVARLQTSINTLEDLARQTKISYGTLRHSTYSEYFRRSHRTLYQDMYTHMTTRDTMMSSPKEGLAKVRKSSDFAFIADADTLEWEAQQKPCNLRVVGNPYFKIPWVLGVPKHSPYREELSGLIMRLHENGFMDHLMQKWILSGECECDTEASTEIDDAGDELHYTNILGVFYIICGALALSFVVIVVEWVVKICVAVEKDDPQMPNTLVESTRRHVNMWKKDVYFDWLFRLPAIGRLSHVKWGKQEAARCDVCGAPAHHGECPQEWTRGTPQEENTTSSSAKMYSTSPGKTPVSESRMYSQAVEDDCEMAIY